MLCDMPPLGRPPKRSSSPVDGEVLTVAALLKEVRRRLENEFDERWVEGELSEVFRSQAGHLYVTLRDEKEDASLRVVMWSTDVRRLRVQPEAGKLVRVWGTLTLYSPRGAFQMRATRLVEAGAGDLKRRFEQALARLAAKGLLAPERKRPIPATPRQIGLVTSRDGAALRDILKVLRDRLPVRVVLAHSSVQGEAAPAAIVEALTRLAESTEVEVIIVGRGGGSADDLSAWNDERVALAVAACPVPVISAVGHETDTTLVDLVADARAATPSEAAMMALPGRTDLLRALSGLNTRLTLSTRVEMRHQRALLAALGSRLPEGERLLDLRRQKLDDLTRAAEASIRERLARAVRRHDRLESRMVRQHPGAELERSRVLVGRLSGRLERWSASELEHRRARLGRAAASLQALSPLHVLGRGYALVRRSEDGSLVSESAQVAAGDRVEVRLSQGLLDCEVKASRPE
jgi:exodeoxyribonuclease VII large subunit